MNKEYKEYKAYKDIDNKEVVDKNFVTKALVSILALLLAFMLTLTSCGTSDTTSSAITTTSAEQGLDNAVSKSEMFTERDLADDYDESAAETITLSGTSANTTANSGVTIDGSTVTITEEGVYVVSGTLTDGQIIVDSDDNAKVQIVLKDAEITSETSAAIYVKSADKVFITTAEGTENTLANGGSFTADGDTNVDGAVYAKDDITFNGSGSLTITSPAGHGIVGKDDVKLSSVMRDTLVEIPGHGQHKLNSAYSYGGAEMAMRVINETFRLNITNYAAVDLRTLVDVIDAVGGVYVNVSEAELPNVNKYAWDTYKKISSMDAQKYMTCLTMKL